MKKKWVDAFMDTAERFAQLSSAVRLKVGAVVVKDNRIISIGYNGMPAGWDNNCEDTVVENYAGFEGAIHSVKLKTKPEVLHAETNAIAKLARSTESGLNAAMFVTHSPCLDCAKLIYQSGINRVFYRDAYRSENGIQFLKQSGIEVTKVEKDR